MPPVLYFFALCNLVIGSGAFVLGGILVPLSESLHISLAAAGQAMTAYAVSTALLAPVLIIATARWQRKRAVQLALALFAAGCLVCALSGSLVMLLLGRVLMGAGAARPGLVHHLSGHEHQLCGGCASRCLARP